MDNTQDLRALLISRHPLLFVASEDEERLLVIVTRAADALSLPVWTWSATTGLARAGKDPQYGTTGPIDALRFIAELSAPGVFVLADLHPYLSDPLVVRALKEMAIGADPGQTIVAAGPGIETPSELTAVARRWRLEPPDADEIADLLDRTLRDLKTMGITIALDTQARASMVAALRGLSVGEAQRLIQEAAADRSVTGEDVSVVLRSKAELLTAGGILELVVSEDGTLDRVGGFESLKNWISLRAPERRIDAQQLGIDHPRGILLTGIPGCGKSLVAKTLARTWGLPLVLLDPARLYSKWVGDSERRLAQALESVDSLSPAVLWIDEIEKGLATGTGDGGVATRLLGTFLRWMQDRSGDVFLVATANDVRALPPELLRKGRFDAIFFVDLPDAKARGDIFRSHLEQRGHDPDAVDGAAIVSATAGFSGAEIEAAVVGALYRTLAGDGPLTSDLLMEEIAATVPLSVSRSEDLARLRAWGTERATPV
ncbi:MAG: AAA family ATPase [Acidimicrobiia bacterium]